MAAVRHDAKEVRGACCPACGRAGGIRRERRAQDLDAGDVVAAWLFGLLGVLLVLGGRTTVRLRCTACRCRFPEPLRPARAVVVFGVLGCLLGFAAFWFVSGRYGPVAGYAAAGGAALLMIAGLARSLRRSRGRMALWRERHAGEMAGG